METVKEFSIKKTLKRIVKELNDKIESIRRPRPNEKERYSKEGFFVSKYKDQFPVSRDTYYSYSAFANSKNPAKNIQSIDLRTFYDICTYTNVSADYLLGLIDTKRKEHSAEKVREEFGLSDKAMERLRQIKNHRPEWKGEISTNIVNYILENDNFWNELNGRLPVYVTCMYDVRSSGSDVDMARYGIIRTFEKLIDEICECAAQEEIPLADLGDTYPFN